MPYLSLVFLLPSAGIFPLSFSIPLRYHFVTSPLLSCTFPVPCYLSSARLFPAEYPRLYTLRSTSTTPSSSLGRVVPQRNVVESSCCCCWFSYRSSLIFIYFYRAHRARIFVQIFIAVTFSTQNLHIRKFFCTFAPDFEKRIDLDCLQPL